MLIKTLPVGQLETNCYVVTDEATLECAVIDPGAEANVILDYLEDNRLRCRAVMLTHAHFDHTGALGEVLDSTGAQLYVNEKERGTGIPGFRGFQPPEGAVFYGEGDTVKVGSLEFRVMATPGHTPGGVTLVCGGALFTGDTLFRGSCGRTDFPGGDLRAELASLARIGRLPGDYEVYPGHDLSTRLSIEREHNPYMRRALSD